MLSAEALAEAVRRYRPGARLAASRRLTGGMSAIVMALDLAWPGGAETVVLRRHGPRDLARNPDIARDEAALLAVLEGEGVPIAPVVFHDPDPALLGAPYLFARYVAPGDPPADMESRMAAMAEALARLHRLPGNDPRFAFLPAHREVIGGVLRRVPAEFDDALSEGIIRDTLARHWPPSAATRPEFLLHGDLWSGNLIWQAGRIAALLDWEDAMIGEPIADIAITRQELYWSDGEAGAAAFTARYVALTGLDTSGLALFDLAAALRPCGHVADWDISAENLALMRERHALFVAQALAAL